MNRIEAKFRELQKKNQKALIAFITAGYPSLSVTERLVLQFARNGVDIVELGVPFSDPMADGPLIQEASQFALKRGVNLARILKTVKNIRRHTQIPICLMTYYNPIFSFGEERFARVASSCGVDGVIIPDLPPEEASTLEKLARRYRLDLINFISPTTDTRRIKRLARLARGFLYYVSLTGVTGVRQKLSVGLIQRLRQIKRYTSKPVCVGFGISSYLQVKELWRIADGVIVGSAIVKKIKENIKSPDLIKRVVNFVVSLKG